MADSLNNILNTLEALLDATESLRFSAKKSDALELTINKLETTMNELDYRRSERAMNVLKLAKREQEKQIKQGQQTKQMLNIAIVPEQLKNEVDVEVHNERSTKEASMALNAKQGTLFSDEVFPADINEVRETVPTPKAPPIPSQKMRPRTVPTPQNTGNPAATIKVKNKKARRQRNNDGQTELFQRLNELETIAEMVEQAKSKVDKSARINKPDKIQSKTAPIKNKLKQPGTRVAKQVLHPMQKAAAVISAKRVAETKHNDLLIGIDLGTTRTAVMSSRGIQHSFESVVGYAKDLVGQRLLGADYLVGDTVLEKVYLDKKYPLEDGAIKQTGGLDHDAARKLIQHAVTSVQPLEDERICAVIGVPARASQVNKDSLLELASEYIDVAMVVSEPFMVAYGLGELVNSIIVDIGAGTIDFCAMKGHLPAINDQLGRTKAGNSIDALLLSAIKNRHPEVQLTLKDARALKEQYGFVGRPSRTIEVVLQKKGKPTAVDITLDLRRACESIVPELVERLLVMIASFEPRHRSRAMRNIILSGGGSKITGLDQILVTALHEYGKAEVKHVDDIINSGAAGALLLACELPPAYWGEFEYALEYND